VGAPIRNRIDMLATGIKSPVGIKVAGPDLATIDKLAAQIESAVRGVPGVSSALAERLTGGRYIDVDVDRQAAARFGLSVADVQAVISTAIGGENVGEVIQGRERFPVNVRYPREIRDSLERLRKLPFVTDKGATVLLQDVAKIVIAEGPPMIRSENARLSGWVYVMYVAGTCAPSSMTCKPLSPSRWPCLLAMHCRGLASSSI
jgi:Cu(I)/Ag(I) efflux system membrane protein CusA/SilA